MGINFLNIRFILLSLFCLWFARQWDLKWRYQKVSGVMLGLPAAGREVLANLGAERAGCIDPSGISIGGLGWKQVMPALISES